MATLPPVPLLHGTRDIPPSSPDDAGDTFLFSCLSSLIVSTSSGCRAVYDGSVWKCMAVTNGWVTRAGNQTLHQSWERRGGVNTADTRTLGTQGFNVDQLGLI